MTPAERDLTTILLDRLNKIEGQPRDPEAETLIRETMAVRTDAPYSLVQTVLNIAILLTLIGSGYGLYGLACAASLPALVFCSGVGLRLRWLAPDLFAAWPRPKG